MDGIVNCCLRRTWACGIGDSRGERKHSITPGDARTFANPTCGASARLVSFFSSYVCDFVLVYLVAVVSIYFLPAIYRRGVRYEACSCFYFLGS